jgi:hypothetical protein
VSPGRLLPGALLLALLLAPVGCSRTARPDEVRAWNAEIEALQAEQDSLRVRAAELVSRDESLRRIPKGDVVLSVPTRFIRRVLERVFEDVVDNVTLSLKGLKAHIARSVKKVVPIGEFAVDIDIHEVRGRLRPRIPQLVFGGNRVAMSLPVEVSQGDGNATVHFVWDGKNVSGMTCGDMDVTQKVTGSVIPAEYVLEGSVKLATRGSRIVCTPEFPETRIRLRLEPSRESWEAVNAILAEKQGACGWVLDKVDVPGMLKELVQEKGFDVKLPVHKITPFALPAGVRDTIQVGGRVLTFTTRTNTLRIDPDAIWYSADVAVKSE